MTGGTVIYPYTKSLKATLSLPAYKLLLSRNREAVRRLLDGERQTDLPALSKYLRAHEGSAGWKLNNLHRHFIEYDSDRPYPSLRPGEGWFIPCSYDRMQSLGGSLATWTKLIPRLCALGLLNSFKPDTHQESVGRNTPEQKRSAERAIERGRNPVTWYNVPEYTEELLQEAEKRASALASVHGKLTKDGMRETLGTEIANAADGQTFYNMHPEAFDRLGMLAETLRELIGRNGYTTAEELTQTVYNRLEQLAPGRHSMRRIMDTWNNSPALAEGMKIGRPTKAEAQTFGLSNLKHIIRPQGNLPEKERNPNP